MRRIKIISAIVTLVLVVTGTSTTVHAASYDDISAVVLGNGVSVSVYKNYSICTETVSELINKKSYSVETTDTFTYSKDITFSYTCSTAISTAISATTGEVSGALGNKLSNAYSYEPNNERNITKSITPTNPANNTFTINAYALLKVFGKNEHTV